MTSDPLLNPLPVAAERLGISHTTLKRIIRRGEIAVAHCGRRTLIAEHELRRYAASLSGGATEEPELLDPREELKRIQARRKARR